MPEKTESVFQLFEKGIVWFCRTATGAAFLILIVSVLIQVVGRTSGFSIVWTEELTRFALLYMIAFGVGLALKSGDLVNVDVLCASLPDGLFRILRILIGIIVICFCVFLLPPALHYTSIGELQTSPAMGIRMNFVHVTMFILPVALAIFALLGAVNLSVGKSTGLPNGKAENETADSAENSLEKSK